MAGASAAAGAGGAYAATRPHDKVEESTHTDRSFPLSGGAIAPHNNNRPTSSTYSSEAPAPQPTSGNVGHIAGLNTGTAGGVGAESGDAARANLGLARHSAIDHSGHSHEFHGDPCETESAEKTLSHVPGPHATVAANMLDPHVPGEFPREDGLDPHSSEHAAGFGQTAEPSEPSGGHHLGRDAALVGGAGAAGLGAHEALKSHSSPAQQPAPASATGTANRYPSPLGSHEALADRTVPTQQPTYSPSNQSSPALGSSEFPPNSQTERSSNDHHLGRNAALAGGAGAAGLGAYAATRDRNDPADSQQPQGSSALHPSTSGSTTSQPLAQSQSPQHVPGNPLTGAKESQQEHHYGRDAALVGGAGAAGAAGYATLHDDRGDTGPASKTIGPHESNIANIVDPRVRPEPEKMKDHTTAGPWQSDTLNKLDPKVESDPNKADVKVHGYATGVAPQPVGQQQQQQQLSADQDNDHHYGRDAAVVGGTGAAAYGATQAYDQHEQEKLAKEQAKEQEKQAKHDAKEQEKQAKHDAKEQEKQAKHDAKEAEKAQKKEEEKRAKEQEKLDKQHAKEQEKAEEKRLKEQEKAEEKRQKGLEKLQHDKEKEDAKLAAARHDEAENKHKHNKLHKEAPEEREDKGGILHRIFHHKHYEREGAEGTSRTSGSFEEGRSSGGLASSTGEEGFERRGAPSSSTTGQTVGDEQGLGKSSLEQPGLGGDGDGVVKDGTTGLPMNVGKYGQGVGGTDGNEAIAGHYAK